MILDKIENFRYHQRCIPEIWDAVRFIEKVKRENLPAGRYPVGKGFAFVQEGKTRAFDEADFEVHKDYFDMQVLLEGEEMWEYADVSTLQEKIPYDSSADIQWLTGTGQKIAMKPGMFYIVYPTDAHKPCCHEKQPAAYRKVVVKIRIDKLLHGVTDRKVPWQRR